MSTASMEKYPEKSRDRLTSPIEQLAYECADKLLALDPQSRAESVQILMRRLAEVHNNERMGLEMEQAGLSTKLEGYHRTDYHATGLGEDKGPRVARSTY